MNKRYMDFVPARPAKKKPTPKTAPNPATVSRGVHRSPKISKSSLGTIEPLSAKPIKAQKVGSKWYITDANLEYVFSGDTDNAPDEATTASSVVSETTDGER